MRKIPKEAKDIALVVLSDPSLHYVSCREDISGRPQELKCVCPMKYAIDKVTVLEVDE